MRRREHDRRSNAPVGALPMRVCLYRDSADALSKAARGRGSLAQPNRKWAWIWIAPIELKTLALERWGFLRKMWGINLIAGAWRTGSNGASGGRDRREAGKRQRKQWRARERERARDRQTDRLGRGREGVACRVAR